MKRGNLIYNLYTMEKVKEFLVKVFLNSRMKSLYWRAGDMVVAGLAIEIPAALADVHVANWVVVAAGLTLGEITKYLNKKAK